MEALSSVSPCQRKSFYPANQAAGTSTANIAANDNGGPEASQPMRTGQSNEPSQPSHLPFTTPPSTALGARPAWDAGRCIAGAMSTKLN